MKKTFCLLICLGLMAAGSAYGDIKEGLVLKLKKTVVNVEKLVTVGLNSEYAGQFRASGFIVDAKQGLIATNRHVTGTSPSIVKITFENGSSTEANLVYYDAWHDFGIYKVDPAKVEMKIEAVELGSSFGLKEQDDVFMIGNNDGEEYSVKFGKISNLYLNKGARHSATLQTTFDRAGGSSGSPVFNADGKAVAIHFAGTETTSFEMRIEYLRDALSQLKKAGKVRRGDVGLQADLILVSDAQKHFHLDEATAKKVKALRQDLKQMVAVRSRVPRTPAFSKLLPGDLILTVDGIWVGDNLYLMDKLVDAKVGGTVTLGMVRNGNPFKAKLEVSDAESLKIQKFVQWAGGVLQDPTPELRLNDCIETEGVFLTQCDNGSSLTSLGYPLEGERYMVMIEGVNGAPTPNLKTFVHAVKDIKDLDHIYLIVRDKNAHNSNIKAVPIILSLKFFPLKVNEWSSKAMDWVEVKE